MNERFSSLIAHLVVPKTSKVVGFSWLAIAAVILALYARSLRFPLINYDDFSYINTTIQSGLNLESLRYAFTSRFGYYSPITWLSFIVECTLFPGTGASVFRLTNIWLHIANCLLLFRVLQRLFPNSRCILFVPIFFALHPVQVESIVWVSERKGLLAALFALLCINTYVSFATHRNPRFMIQTCIWFLLSAFSKPAFVCLPALLLFVRKFILEDRTQITVNTLAWKLDLSLCVIAGCLIPIHIILQKGTLASTGLSLVSPGASAGSYVLYIAKVLYPADLIIPYQRYEWSVIQEVAAFSVVVSMTCVFWKYRIKEPGIIFGWLWFLILLFPASGIVPLGENGLANRYLYLPCAGLMMIATLFVENMIVSAKRYMLWLSISCCSISIILISLTWRQIGYWSSTSMLFTRTLQVDPHNNIARGCLFREAIRQNDFAKAQSYSSRLSVGNYDGKASLCQAYFYTIDNRHSSQ